MGQRTAGRPKLLRIPDRAIGASHLVQTISRVFGIIRRSGRGTHMQGEKKERWMELCAQAAVEQDPKKLMELVREINALLEEKERRLGITPPQHP